MPDKNLTDNDIKKALEEWIKNYAGPYVKFKTLGDALAYINRLEAENEGLKAKCENTQVGYNFLKADFEETEKRNRDLVRAFQSYKAEAYKEFAERLEPLKKFRSCVTESEYELSVTMREIDNLLKEMVGEDNAKEKE